MIQTLYNKDKEKKTIALKKLKIIVIHNYYKVINKIINKL